MINPRNEIVGTLGGVPYQSGGIARDGTVTLFRKGGPQPDDPRFRYDEKWDLWEAKVLPDDCDRLVAIYTWATYLGVLCQVMGVSDDAQATLYHIIGPGSGETERLGFKEIERGVWAIDVPVSELYDYHEIHTDLLFNRWRELTFAKPAEVASS